MNPKWFTESGLKIANSGKLLPGESISDAWMRISTTANKHIKIAGFDSDLYEAFYNGYIGAATPVLANMGAGRGLPISCFALHVDDSLDSIGSHIKELIKLTQMGGGVGCYWGDIRASGSPITGGGVHDGLVRFAVNYDRIVGTINQGGFRRGSATHGISIDHPDAINLLKAKDHKGGDPRGYIDGTIYLTLTDSFMERLIDGDEEAKELMNLAQKTRLETGSPYFVFLDNINQQNPQAYNNYNLQVSGTNICSEIVLFTDESHTFVCCLSSLNLAKFDEWHNWRSPNLRMTVPELATYLLDATLSEFIVKGRKIRSMGRAIRSAEKGRAIGIGAMGWHDYLQQHNLPFGSKEALRLNKEIFSYIRCEADKASIALAQIFGEPKWCQGTGYRNSHRLAIAPTKTNSKITNSGSEGIEPYISNYFRAKDKINITVKNRNLEKLLKSKGKDTFEVWESINDHLGSVMHLDFLTIEEKLTYLTAREIDPMDIVKQGCDRQVYVDQAISTNLFASPFTSLRKLNEPVIYAWANNLKTLYYLKSSSSTLVEAVAGRAVMVGKDDCEWCEKAKKYLIDIDYEIEYHRLEDIDPNYFHWETVPRIWLDGHYIGTYQDMVEYFNTKNSNDGVVEQNSIEECSNCEA